MIVEVPTCGVFALTAQTKEKKAKHATSCSSTDGSVAYFAYSDPDISDAEREKRKKLFREHEERQRVARVEKRKQRRKTKAKRKKRPAVKKSSGTITKCSRVHNDISLDDMNCATYRSLCMLSSCAGRKFGVTHLVCFKHAKYLDESSASEPPPPDFDTEESGDYYMGRTSPISSIADFHSDMRADSDSQQSDGWVSRHLAFACLTPERNTEKNHNSYANDEMFVIGALRYVMQLCLLHRWEMALKRLE